MKMRRAGVLLVLVLGVAASRAQISPVPASPAPAATDDKPGATEDKPAAAEDSNSLPVAAKHYIEYPSLEPVTAITVTVGKPNTKIYDLIRARAGNSAWSCALPEFYKVDVVDASHKVTRELKVRSVHLIGFDPHGVRYTRCDGRGNPLRLDLILDGQPKVGELIQVSMYDVDRKTVMITSDGKLAMTATNLPTLAATPQAAPGETLNNAAKRDVGQLNLALADTNLVRNSPVNVYANTADVLSTDGKDSKSAVAVTAGMQRGLLPRWYSPIDLEESLKGNQTAKNLSAVTSLGFHALPPWRWASTVLDNRVISAPLPPEPEIDNLYTRRIEQMVTAKTPLLAVNDYALHGSFAWNTISFPFTCKLLVWEKPATKTAVNGTGVDKKTDAKVTPVKTPASLPAPATTNCLGTELNLGVWYLPLDLTKRGTQKAEGYGDVSILIPLSDFSVASSELQYVTKGDPMKFQIRIKYSDAVNQANNYARTRAWTFGLEALK
jgi:hypothetical protein